MKRILTLFAAAALVAACAPDLPVRLTTRIADASVAAAEYVPFRTALEAQTEPPFLEAEKRDGGYALPDDGAIYLVRLRFEAPAEEEVRMLLLMPGERLAVGGRLHHADGEEGLRIEGSELYETMALETEPYRTELDRFERLDRRLREGDALSEQELRTYDSLMHWRYAYLSDRIRNHPDAPSTAYYLSLGIFSPRMQYKLYYQIPEQVRSGKYKQFYDLIRPGGM